MAETFEFGAQLTGTVERDFSFLYFHQKCPLTPDSIILEFAKVFELEVLFANLPNMWK